jgi:hypothetical protein
MTCTATHLGRRREERTRRSNQGILEKDKDEKHQAIPGQEGGLTRKSRLYPMTGRRDYKEISRERRRSNENSRLSKKGSMDKKGGAAYPVTGRSNNKEMQAISNARKER